MLAPAGETLRPVGPSKKYKINLLPCFCFKDIYITTEKIIKFEAMKAKLYYPCLLALIIALSSCSSKLNTSSRQALRVPIAINIITDNSVNLTDLNPDLYRLKVLAFLDDFVQADLVLAEKNEKPDVILDIDVKDFRILPRKESGSTRTVTRIEQVGWDAKGQPIYKTFTDQIYTEILQIPSTTRLSSKFTFKDPSFNVRPQNYYAGWTWRNGGTAVDGDLGYNLTGLSSRRLPNGEPFAEDFLFQMSQEMLTRASYDLRKYYQKISH
jgi:hypothetical protein